MKIKHLLDKLRKRYILIDEREEEKPFDCYDYYVYDEVNDAYDYIFGVEGHRIIDISMTIEGIERLFLRAECIAARNSKENEQ